MNDSPDEKRNGKASRPARTEGTLAPVGRQPIDDLVDRIKQAADQLARDKSSRGDLKLLSRTLRELRYAFKVFSPYRRRRKVTIFGSARTPSGEPAYQQTVDFARQMAHHQWLIVTGAASGIMEAGHVGAGREMSMGLNIMLPFEQSANAVIAGDEKLVNMKYFFTRKLMFVKECDAVVCLPGGFGTLDEATEVLTLLQTGKRDIVPLILLDSPDGDFWSAFQEFVIGRLLRDELISPEDIHLYRLTDRCDEAVQEILNFYRIYHSMRYVRDRLVLRLQRRPSETLLQELVVHFGSIAVDGKLELTGPLPEEENEPEWAELPRLVLRFDRRSLGRLRLMIDCLNAESIEPLVRAEREMQARAATLVRPHAAHPHRESRAKRA
jgi:uncharacterized protein (TIGR00730 family)